MGVHSPCGPTALGKTALQPPLSSELFGSDALNVRCTPIIKTPPVRILIRRVFRQSHSSVNVGHQPSNECQSRMASKHGGSQDRLRLPA